MPRLSDTLSVTIAAGAIATIPDIFARCFGDQAAIIIADENTYAAAGAEVNRVFASTGRRTFQPFLFPGFPTLSADHQNLLKLETALRMQDAIPVAVGSGTINDLTKLASHKCVRSYMVVATAASVDGYASFGAAITRDGFKRTLACPAPRGVVADLDILAGAPQEMTSWGYGDLIGKLTAGADWLIADVLGIEPLVQDAWSMVQDHLRHWITKPQLLNEGNRQALGNLTTGLVMSGLAMQIARSSRPASASEHQFSHLWEMQGLEYEGKPVSHGFKVGVGTLASTALYERVLERDLRKLDVEAICRSWPTRSVHEEQVRRLYPNHALADQAVEQSLAKFITAEQLRHRLEHIQERWPYLQKLLMDQLINASELRQMLAAAGCPTKPDQIGLDVSRLKASYLQARHIRSRYTIFDLAAEAGILGDCVEELFERGGFWAEPTE